MWNETCGRSANRWSPVIAPEPGIDAYVWIKPPGEQDGFRLGPPGAYNAAYADDLVEKARQLGVGPFADGA